jgi:nitrite reductase/ring-hydroxylating ferredoxin subunit/alkylhydroperoxidase/carboxymuconolactone decarboxylase family protein YurZ
MSTPDEPRGREFLEKARPEAMTHLMAFFKESGKHLDPKTRFLVSVVTKVINYSPRGLKQYIKRAMEAGATKDEVLDVILCAYPCAGLTKVCDATTVFLDMGLGEGMAPGAAKPAAAAAPATGHWMALQGTEKLAEGEMTRCNVEGLPLCVARLEGKLFAISDVCAHRGGSLADGEFEAGAVTCPLHGWQFNLKDGSSGGVGKGGAAVYEVREAGGRAEVRIPAK